MRPDGVLSFWFREVPETAWFRKDPSFDLEIRDRFTATHVAASAGELWSWRSTAEGRLAEILVLDQFSRNLFRDTPSAFAQDAVALVLAQEAVGVGVERELEPRKRAFLYMPFMHSESRKIQARSVALFSDPELSGNLSFAMAHQRIVDRFGRYPHRNAVLGRVSTEAEIAFLQEAGSSF